MKGKVGCRLLLIGYFAFMLLSLPTLEHIHDIRITYRFEEEPINAVLYVEDRYVIDENVVIHKMLDRYHSDYSGIPLTKTLEALGYNVTWLGKDRIYMNYKDNSFVIDLNKEKLIRTKPYYSEEWFFELVGGIGSNGGYQLLQDKDEMIIGEHLLYCTMIDMNDPAQIESDISGKAVYIERQDTLDLQQY